MVSYDRAKFADGMDEMAIVLGANLPGEKKKLAFWNLLVQFDLIIVLAAFERCKAVLKKFPVPAEIVEQINLERQERCRLAEMNEEDKVVMWERDRQAHPE